MTISIGLGEYRVGRVVPEQWVMYGLGSCIGLIVADRLTGISGAAHVVLPTHWAGASHGSARYADRAVPLLVEKVRDMGTHGGELFAVMAGGARMFDIGGIDDIGRRNIQTVREQLAYLGVRLVASDVGGHHGRTLWWEPGTGIARISQYGRPDRILTPPDYRYGTTRKVT